MTRVACYVTGCGNVAFAAKFLESWYCTGPTDVPVFYAADTASGCDFSALQKLFGIYSPITKATASTSEHFSTFTFMDFADERGGCNSLWSCCVRHAAHYEYDVAVVLNDDIMAPKPGWIGQMIRVLEQNDHVAMTGIGSDGAWEQEHRHRERWFTDPSFIAESAVHCEDFRDRPVKYVHHVAGPCWACKPKLWLDAGGIPEQFFWAFGEVIPCIELRKMGYQSVAVQWPVTINHFGGGAFYDIHSDAHRHESFSRRASQYGDEGKMFADKYGTGHIHLLAKEFDAKLPSMNLPPILYDPQEFV